MSPEGPVESLSENRCAVVVGQDLYCVSNSKVQKFNVLELSWTEVREGKTALNIVRREQFSSHNSRLERGVLAAV